MATTLWIVNKYQPNEIEEFQRKVIDLVGQIRMYIDDKDGLHDIANTLEEIAYNENLPIFPNGF